MSFTGYRISWSRTPARVVASTFAFAFAFVLALAGAPLMEGTLRAQSTSLPGLLILQIPDHAKLILQLDHDDFEVRQHTEQKLLRSGVDSWDSICLATKSSNVEIARIAERLLQQIPFEEHLTEYVPACHDYRERSFADRGRLIIHLGRLSGPNEQAALALLTRYESDEVLSRSAALELITNGQAPIANLGDLIKTSSRTAAVWLRTHAATESRLDFIHRWQPVMQQLPNDGNATEQPHITGRLLRWYAEQLFSLVDHESQVQIDWAVRQIVDRTDSRPEDVVETFDWLLLHHQIAGADLLSTRFNDLTTKDPRLVFRRAELERVKGNENAAIQIVASSQSYNADSEEDPMTRLQLAMNLQLAGHDYWAGREMTAIIASQESNVTVRIQACSLLAESQYQRGNVAEARDLLAQAKELLDMPAGGESAVVVLNQPIIETRYLLFAHLTEIENGNWKEAKTFLLRGLEQSPDQSDLLISMIRFTGYGMSADETEQWRETAGELVKLSLAGRSETIENLRSIDGKDARQARLHREELVRNMNSYAWLASQTGVSLEKAELYAREAWQLSPGDSYVMDTLAACLFSQSKLDEAIAFQQRAVNSAPWSKQIRSGLVRYRSAMMFSQMPSMFR